MTNKKNQNRTGELFSVKYSKLLSFSHVAEALMGLIYHRPSGENSKFLCLMMGEVSPETSPKKHYDSRHDKLRNNIFLPDRLVGQRRA